MSAVAWSNTPPVEPCYAHWRDPARPMHATSVLMRVVWSAPRSGGLQHLLAGPWGGGLERVDAMGGEWQLVPEARV